jgi:Uma2 family endonuclease
MWNTEKLELIQGDLIDKMSKTSPHVDAMMLVMEWLVTVFGMRFIRPEAPIDVSPEDNPTSEPQPDLAVLKQPRSAYRDNPKPSDLSLVVEVSDTTLTFDMRVKARLYARAGIVEYWVVDVDGRRIVVHRNPQGGTYSDVKSYAGGESVEPLAAPGKSFPVDDAFGVQP